MKGRKFVYVYVYCYLFFYIYSLLDPFWVYCDYKFCIKLLYALPKPAFTNDLNVYIKYPFPNIFMCSIYTKNVTNNLLYVTTTPTTTGN